MRAGLTQAGPKASWSVNGCEESLDEVACESCAAAHCGRGTLCCACAQQPAGTGSLAGKLTDAHSSPLENMTVTLRNAANGATVQTTTAHGGRYRFSALVQGEYTLTATDPRGTGQVNGIYVAAGHEAQVQTAIELHLQPLEVVTGPKISGVLASAPESPPSYRTNRHH